MLGGLKTAYFLQHILRKFRSLRNGESDFIVAEFWFKVRRFQHAILLSEDLYGVLPSGAAPLLTSPFSPILDFLQFYRIVLIFVKVPNYGLFMSFLITAFASSLLCPLLPKALKRAS